MSGEATEGRLHEWRYGQAQAERLCAAVLHVEGYEDVDPQSPLGGPDGLKDVLCQKAGRIWIAAAFFPPTLQTFREIEKKFLHDLEGVAKNGADGMVFFVNQHLTVGEREQLQGGSDVTVEIYHLERIRGVLDAPKGCGIRLEYLRIPMTEEEQWSFWHAMNYDTVRKLLNNSSRLDDIEAKLELILERTRALDVDLLKNPSSLGAASENAFAVETPTAQLSVATLGWLHRIVTEDDKLPPDSRGRLRAVQVWIGPPGDAGRPMPTPEQVVQRLPEFLSWWRARHVQLRTSPREEVVRGLAEFHHRFLSIHPFLDANGRVARLLLDQAARELLNQSVGRELTTDPEAYLRCLRSADEGDLDPLHRLIGAALQ